MDKPKLVVDTNVLLVSISSYSKYHWFYKALISDQFDCYITNEILLEYEEIIGIKWSESVAKSVTRTLIELENVFLTTSHYRLNLIPNDPDDNKFVDCAFANNVDFLITNDRHFDVLGAIEYPKIKTIRMEDFEKLIV